MQPAFLNKKRDVMIELTRLNGRSITINADMIVSLEETPDTVVTLNTGIKYVVKESRQEIINLVILYKQDIFSGVFSREDKKLMEKKEEI